MKVDGSDLQLEYKLARDIYMVDADGSGLVLLIEDGFWADWLPDGEKLVSASEMGTLNSTWRMLMVRFYSLIHPKRQYLKGLC
jgi:hypothetical protein